MMLRSFFFIAFLIGFSYNLSGQTPAYKYYNIKEDLPENNYIYVNYTNDTLFISTDEVKLYCFNGIEFCDYPSPQSKYIFMEIHFLKKGYFTRNTRNHYWYKPLGKEWQTIPTPKSNIVYRDTLFGFNSDSISYFDEDLLKWKFIKKLINTKITTIDYHPYLLYTENNDTILTLRKKNNPNKLYDVFNDNNIYFSDYKMRSKGIINKKTFYLNKFKGNMKWDRFETNIKIFPEILNINHYNPLILQNKFNINNTAFASNIIKHINHLYFFTIDTFSGFNYSGNFNIPRANYQKIREDLYFIGSFEGMYKVNPFITFYSPENSNINKNVRSIVKHKNKIWTGGYGSGFCRLDSVDFISSTAAFQKGEYKNVLNGGFALNDNSSWFFNEGYNTMLILSDNKLYDYQIYANGQRTWLKGFYIDTLNNGRLAFSLQYDTFGMLDSVVGNRIYITSISTNYGLKHGDSWAFDQDSINRIWLARFTAGIAVYDIDKETVIPYQYNLDNKKSFGVISLYIDKNDQLWMGTTKGLYILPEISKFDIFKDNIFTEAKHINLPNNDNSLVSSIKDIGKYIAIGNRTGISFLKNSNYKDIISSPIHQLIYGEDINGHDTELNSMYFDDNRYLWLSTKNGVLKIDTWNIKVDSSPVKIVFEKIINADKPLSIDNDKIQISSVKRNISFTFKPEYNPSFLNNIYYSYLLTNSKNDTIAFQELNKNNTFRIDYLAPDKYKFKVDAFKNGILMDSKTIGISVPFTFWENPWMWVIFITVSLLLLSGFLYYRKEKIKQIAVKEQRLSKAEKEKGQLKIQTIINAFNPHFINNSLHWVQSRYYKDPQMAKLIGRLSENINYIFKKTKEGDAIHSLKDELNLVNNYITIQKIRFSNSFKYIQPDEKTIEKYSDFKLVVMQIQIHVENAVEHGIRNRVNSNYVEVKINENNGFFIITITDDGIGRIKAKQVRSRGSQTGLKMLKEIHSLFNNNPENINKITTVYEDEIFTNNNIKYGTRVIISIPKDFIYSV